MNELFKYFSPQIGQNFLQSWALRFTPPDLFNDPFEFRPLLSLCSADFAESQFHRDFDRIIHEQYHDNPILAALGISFEWYQAYAESRREPAAKEMVALLPFFEAVTRDTLSRLWAERIGVLCLSEDHTNLLMWAHYADSHRGICVGFDSSHSFFCRRIARDDELRQLRKLSYSKDRPHIELVNAVGFSDFLTKSMDWSYEREWRMLMPLEDANVTVPGNPRPISLFNVAPSAVTKIFIGAAASHDTIEVVKGCLANRSDAAHIAVYRMQLSEAHYRLEPIRVT